MRNADGRLAFSATDLSRHLSCGHLTSLRRAVALGEIDPPPPYDDSRADVLRQRGIEHEQRLLEQFATDGRTAETITATDAPFSERDPEEAATRTREAMRRGADVIYQRRLEDDDRRWSGYPDFLLRVDRQSALGDWSYEVLDAKLARSAKGEALLQLLLYSDLLTRVQEIAPEWMRLALGGGDGRVEAGFRVVEYAAYYRAVRRRFEAHAGTPPETYPDPVDHCTICDWKQSCAEQRRADDHLPLVAGITCGQRRRLVARDVATMADLAVLGLPAVPRIDGVGDGALARIREQARVQDQARRERWRIHELITPVEADKGLAALPEPSAGDVFFDLEGDAFAADDGLEYLFGVADRDGGYGAQWALDQETEKRVFERFIDRVMARWQQHPGFHIYHYGAYETTAVKRLMSRYATREEEVDRLLRGDVFVDLHRVVRQGLRASVERYSIKKLEPFYGFTRGVELTAATRALIRFEATLESGAAGGAADELRLQIEGFCGTVVALDEAVGTIDLKRAGNSAVPHPSALVPLDTVNSKVLQESLLRLARDVASSDFAPDSPRLAAFDLLRRGETAPPLGPAPRPNRSSLVARAETPLDAVRRIAPGLDRSVLPVQGPPGSGKTYTGARTILDLLAHGQRVGVTANSHKVISNLLDAVCEAADRPRQHPRRLSGGPESRPARRPAPARSADPGNPPARRRRLGARPPPRRIGDGRPVPRHAPKANDARFEERSARESGAQQRPAGVSLPGRGLRLPRPQQPRCGGPGARNGRGRRPHGRRDLPRPRGGQADRARPRGDARRHRQPRGVAHEPAAPAALGVGHRLGSRVGAGRVAGVARQVPKREASVAIQHRGERTSVL